MSNYIKFIMGAACCMALTGCIDNNYDLSDIDTTSEFQVKDLVLPVQLDPVTLSDIINVKDGDQIKEVTINGKTFFAVEETGEFESDGIEVNTFEADSDPLESKTARFKINGAAGLKKGAKRKADAASAYYLIERVQQNIDYEADGIDGSVRELTSLTYNPLSFVILLTSEKVTDNLGPHLENLEIQLPKGLVLSNVTANGYTYNPSDYSPATGVLHLGTIDVKGGKSEIVITSTGIDLSSYDHPFKYDAGSNSGSFSLKSDFTIEDARLTFSTGSDLLALLGEEIDFTVDYQLTPLVATSIMGSIAYDLSGTGLDIDPIELDNLPDFLADPETNLILANPQIYLNLNNPVGEFGLGYQSGLEIISFRQEGDKTFNLGSEITVAGKSGQYNYLLAPDPAAVSDIPEDFASNIIKMTYPDLGMILSGNGLPEKLDIKLIDPQIPVQKLTSPFQLGVELPGMKGTYRFLAPLALEGDSRIVYTKTEDGWWSDDLADLVITKLELSALVSSDLPLDATMAVYPLDKDGNRIQGLTIVPVELPANSQDREMVFSITGEIRNLDGVLITATVTPDSQDALSPDQIITLKNIRVKVSGNYTREL